MAKGDTGSATWNGGLADGKGTISTGSGALDAQPFGFNTRFESEPGTNPEELIAAAFAACFSMALSKELEAEGITDPRIHATSTAHLEKTDAGFRITRVELAVEAGGTASDPDDGGAFDRAVEATKANCPVANLLDADIAYTVTRAT